MIRDRRDHYVALSAEHDVFSSYLVSVGYDPVLGVLSSAWRDGAYLVYYPVCAADFQRVLDGRGHAGSLLRKLARELGWRYIKVRANRARTCSLVVRLRLTCASLCCACRAGCPRLFIHSCKQACRIAAAAQRRRGFHQLGPRGGRRKSAARNAATESFRTLRASRPQHHI